MTENDPLQTPYGITRDVLIRNDILRMENLTLQRQNAQLEKRISALCQTVDALKEQLKEAQTLTDGSAGAATT